MTDGLLGPILDVFVMVAVIGGAMLVVGAGIALSPRLLGRLRQRAYERAAAAELVRLELTPARAGEIDAATATAMVRGLHPRQRRGLRPLAGRLALLRVAGGVARRRAPLAG